MVEKAYQQIQDPLEFWRLSLVSHAHMSVMQMPGHPKLGYFEVLIHFVKRFAGFGGLSLTSGIPNPKIYWSPDYQSICLSYPLSERRIKVIRLGTHCSDRKDFSHIIAHSFISKSGLDREQSVIPLISGILDRIAHCNSSLICTWKYLEALGLT